MKKVHIKTYGCQMNEYDSDKMMDILSIHGFSNTKSMDDASLVILNTCHIREKASEKVFSELGRVLEYKNIRKQNGEDTVVVVAGCTAQAEGDEIIKRAPVVDIVVGPQSYHNLPVLLEEVKRKKKWVIDITFNENEKFDTLPTHNTNQKHSAFVSIQEGCDKFCHFCCVPYTRGAEISRSPEKIIAEISNMIKINSKLVEITLLGQNVNAYHGCDKYGNIWTLSMILEEVSKFESIQRVRYTTSHPIDMNDENLFLIHKKNQKIMPFVHLPVQSGSNKVLKEMNRKHSIENYIDTLRKFKEACSDMAFSSDFIVGYPTETEEDFQDTLELFKKLASYNIIYAESYSFKYSPRPGTPAASRKEQIHEDIKSERLLRLQSVINQSKINFNNSKIGTKMEILVEKKGKHNGQIIGKTKYMQSVVVDISGTNRAEEDYIGYFLYVNITGASQNSLIGKL